MKSEAEEYLTVEQVAQRLGWKPKTVQNKMGQGVFKKDIHYAQAPGLPVMFRWSAVLELYDWTTSAPAEGNGIKGVEVSVPMTRGYSMK